MSKNKKGKKTKMERPSWLLDVPSEEYFAAVKRGEYLTSHKLNEFRKCPLEYKKKLDGEIVEKDTRNFIIGRATHALVLEGRSVFDREFIVSDGPINAKTGKPYGKQTKEWAKWAEEQERTVITSEEFSVMEGMRNAVISHERAMELLKDGIAEGTVRTEWDDMSVQCRMDWFNAETGDIVDLKTCADVDKFRFDIRDFGYTFQMAFYERCVKLAGYDKPVRCWLVAVEKKEPYRVCVVRICEATIEEANVMRMANETLNEANRPMISELKRCQAEGKWPTRFEEVVVI